MMRVTNAFMRRARLSRYYLTAMQAILAKMATSGSVSRIDDIINVAGHRLSTGGMEEVLASHPDVAECAVIGADELKGELPLGLVVLKAGVNCPDMEIVVGVDSTSA
ncbi:MAG: hypothetical protein R3E08_05855 [Thiotrichaceae bacterium]